MPLIFSTLGNFDYLGCYTEQPNQWNYSSIITAADMDPIKCQMNCASGGTSYTFFGLKNGNQCICSSSPRLSSLMTSENNCGTPCSGNSSSPCGGISSLDVWATDSLSASINASPDGYQSLGCYPLGEVTFMWFSSDELTVSLCALSCEATWDLNMFAVSGDHCICAIGLTPGLTTALSPDHCNVPCPGADSQFCGGNVAMNVYRRSEQSTDASAIVYREIDNYKYVGCYSSVPNIATTYTSDIMTLETCWSQCLIFSNYGMFSLFAGSICTCIDSTSLSDSVSVSVTNRRLSISECSIACPGNQNQLCGGPSSHIIYSRVYPLDIPITASQATPSGYVYLGCYSDASYGFVDTRQPWQEPRMTIEFCQTLCRLHDQDVSFGLKNGNQCFCGDVLQKGNEKVADAGFCSSPCFGNSFQKCGGADYISLFARLDTATNDQTGTNNDGANNSNDAVQPVSSATGLSISQSLHETIVDNATYLGCYAETSTGRALSGAYISLTAMTIEVCRNYCYSANFTFFGVEYSQKCFCDNVLNNSSSKTLNQGDCSLLCSGNVNQICGGNRRLSLYTRQVASSINGVVLASSTNVTQGIPAINGYNYLGCYRLPDPTMNATIYRQYSGMTLRYCQQICGYDNNYGVFALKNGNECYCWKTLWPNAITSSSGDCGTPCSGNTILTVNDMCGGVNATSVFTRLSLSSLGNSTNLLVNNIAMNDYTSSGCFAFPVGFPPSFEKDEMTIEFCNDLCNRNAVVQAMFGVYNGRQCFCTQNIRSLTLNNTDSRYCNVSCQGDLSETCGGASAMNLYTRLQSAYPSYFVDPPGYRYMGCFKEANITKALLGSGVIWSLMSAEACSSTCNTAGSNMTYFAVGYQTQCLCSTLLANVQLIQAYPEECSYPCPGNGIQNCGGEGAYALYAGSSTVIRLSNGLLVVSTVGISGSASLIPTISTSSWTTSTITAPPPLGAQATTSILQTGNLAIDPFIFEAFDNCSNKTLCNVCEASYDNFLSQSATPYTEVVTTFGINPSCRGDPRFDGLDILTQDPRVVSSCFPIATLTKTYTEPLQNRSYYNPSSLYTNYAKDPCCGDCTIFAQSASVYYFPRRADGTTAYVTDLSMTL